MFNLPKRIYTYFTNKGHESYIITHYSKSLTHPHLNRLKGRTAVMLAM